LRFRAVALRVATAFTAAALVDAFVEVVVEVLATAAFAAIVLLATVFFTIVFFHGTFLDTSARGSSGDCTGFVVGFTAMLLRAPRDGAVRGDVKLSRHSEQRNNPVLRAGWRRHFAPRNDVKSDQSIRYPRMKTNQIMPRITMASAVLITSNASTDGPRSPWRASVGVSIICPCCLVAMEYPPSADRWTDDIEATHSKE
jgi:hypothetical protein